MTKVHDLEQQLEKLLAQLKSFQSSNKFTEKDITSIQDQLHTIDEQVNLFY
jgi:cell division protein FtsB